MKWCIMALLLLTDVSDMIAQRDTHTGNELLKYIQQGWDIQHQSMSFDSLHIYFSAKAPHDNRYDIYVSEARGGIWLAPVRLPKDINTAEDELWPSISSDEQTLYFVRHTAADPKQKKSTDKNVLYCAQRILDKWEDVAPILIASDDDISPLILADNRVLLFARRIGEGKRNAHYALYGTRRIDAHNWYLPQILDSTMEQSAYAPYTDKVVPHNLHYSVEETVHGTAVAQSHTMPLDKQWQPSSFLTLSGTLRNEQTGQPIEGQIYVYNAITAQLLCTAKSDAVTGKYRIALQQGDKYTIDYTAPNHSHYYLDIDCTKLTGYPEQKQDVSLLNALNIHISTFDSELFTPLQAERIAFTDKKTGKAIPVRCLRDSIGGVDFTLPIGQDYAITFSRRAFEDTTLYLNTAKQVRFTHTELDIPMRAGRNKTQIYIVDSETGRTIDSGRVVLNNTTRREQIIAAPVHNAYTAQAIRDNAYHITTSAVGYFYADTLLTIPEPQQVVTVTIPMRAIHKDAILQLRNITFEYNSHLLTESSYPELERVVALLQDNPDLRIELSAHTDDRGTDAYNDRLSTLRGQAAMDYIVSHGIAPERITSIGYGKRKPIVPNDTDEHRAINRRVEFRVTDM